jgi:hypothetical protein
VGKKVELGQANQQTFRLTITHVGKKVALGQAYQQTFRFDTGIQGYNGNKVGKCCLPTCKLISKVPFPMQNIPKYMYMSTVFKSNLY